MTAQHFDPSANVPEEQTHKTLQELEDDDWGEPSFPSHLVTTCHALRRKPLRDFTVEDLRIMIGQNIGLIYLIPLAISHLQREPLVAGDFYPGDLLEAVLRVKSDFWQEQLHARSAVQAILDQLSPFPESLHLQKVLEKSLHQALLAFQQHP